MSSRFTGLSQRLAAATGALYVVLVIVGNQIATSGTDQSAHPSGANVLADIAKQEHSSSATAGFVLEVTGFVLFMAFLGFLFDVVRRNQAGRRSNIAGAVAVVAGVTMLAIKLGSVAPMGALELDHNGLSPQLAQVLSDMNGVSFVLSWLPYAVFVGAGALGLRRCGLVGRPLAYIGAFIGAAGVVLAVVGLNDPLNGNPMGFLLGLLWTLVVSIRLAVARRREAAVAVPSEGLDAREPVATAGRDLAYG